MPKQTRRNKRNGSRFHSSVAPRPAPRTDSVKDLLARRSPTLTRVTDQVERRSYWSRWLNEHLPAPLCRHMSGVVESEGTLVVFAESAAWSARLRYAIHDLEAQIRAAQPLILGVAVRVLPRA
ncbi:MAG TPA: DciA family protein [Steroidobacteraceae bacterium]|nr:DciA family protein [Steroidobacteraceae bacterium]